MGLATLDFRFPEQASFSCSEVNQVFSLCQPLNAAREPQMIAMPMLPSWGADGVCGTLWVPPSH